MQLTSIKSIFSLFVPIFIAISLQTLSVTIDSVMINHYNPLGTQAIGIASSITMIIGPVFFAIATGINSFSVQYYAQQKTIELKQLMGIAISIILPVVFGCFLLFSLTEKTIVNSLVSIDTPTGQLAYEYFTIFKWSVFLSPFEILFTNQYRAIKKPQVSLVIGFIQLLVNCLFNWILIYQMNMGIGGAAIATLISKIVYIAINYIYSWYIKSPFIGTFKEMFSFNPSFIKKVIIVTSPLLIVEFMYGLSKFFITKIFLLTGVLGYGAYIIANRIAMSFNGLVIAPSQISGIVMGEKIVSNDDKLIKKQLHIIIKFLLIIASVLAILTLTVMPYSIKYFNVDNNISFTLIKYLIYLNGLYMILRIPVASMIATLKAGGDNRFVILLDAGITFIFTLPVMYLCAKNGMGVIGVSVVMVFDMVIKIIVGVLRIKTDKWKNIL